MSPLFNLPAIFVVVVITQGLHFVSNQSLIQYKKICLFINQCPWNISTTSPTITNTPYTYENESAPAIIPEESIGQSSDSEKTLGNDEMNEKLSIMTTCGIRFKNKGYGPTIVGGNESRKHSWPWQIDIRIRGGMVHLCGGTLISPDVVVTAAHCFPPDLYREKYSIYGGVHNLKVLDSAVQVRTDFKVTIHPNFSKNALFDSDLALIKVAQPFVLNNYVDLICLPNKDVIVPNTKSRCTITGWGDTQGTGNGDVLNEVDMLLIDLQKCNSSIYLSGRVTKNMLCAGYDNGGKDACMGDSGGPLMCEDKGIWYIQGIISWGINCAMAMRPGVYTRVYSFLYYMKSTNYI